MTRALVISAVLHLAAVSTSLGSPVEWAGVKDGCLKRCRELFLHSVTEKGPFQYLCPAERRSGTLGVWSGKTGLSIRVLTGNNPTQRFKSLL